MKHTCWITAWLLFTLGALAQGPPFTPPAPPFQPPPDEGLPQLETDMLPPGAGADLLDPEKAPEVVPLVPNIGQLAGVDLEGVEIHDPDNLLPLMARSLLIRTADGDRAVLDERGILAVSVSAAGFSFLDEDGNPVGPVTSWSDVINQVDWSQVTNLPPPQPVEGSQIGAGEIQPHHLGFSPEAAGEPGAVQYNADGHLAGARDSFIHAETGRPAVRAEGGHFLRAYRAETPDPGQMIFTVRRRSDLAEIVLLRDGEETVRLRGDGSVFVAGTLQAEAVQAGASLFVPEAGDLSMGVFTTP